MPLEGAAEAAAELWRSSPDSFAGSSASTAPGGPPPETRRGEPLNPWTIPNAIGFVRLALMPVFLVVGLSSGDGRSWRRLRAVRVHRLERLLRRHGGPHHGPVQPPGGAPRPAHRPPAGACRARSSAGTSRCCRAGRSRCWRRASCSCSASRRSPCGAGIDLEVNMLGRWAVWPVMSALALALLVESWVLGRPAVRRPGDDACGHRPLPARWGAGASQSLNLYLRKRYIRVSDVFLGKDRIGHVSRPGRALRR